jgi:hypothetical protein
MTHAHFEAYRFEPQCGLLRTAQSLQLAREHCEFNPGPAPHSGSVCARRSNCRPINLALPRVWKSRLACAIISPITAEGA